MIVLCCAGTRLYGLDAGIGLLTSLGKSENTAALTLGPVITVDFPRNDLTIQAELSAATLMGSTLGGAVKVYYSLPVKFWRPRAGAGLVLSVNNRILYTSSLAGMSLPPVVALSGIISVDVFRFVFRRSGFSLLTADLSVNLFGAAQEWRAGVTLFRFVARVGHDRQGRP